MYIYRMEREKEQERVRERHLEERKTVRERVRWGVIISNDGLCIPVVVSIL